MRPQQVIEVQGQKAKKRSTVEKLLDLLLSPLNQTLSLGAGHSETWPAFTQSLAQGLQWLHWAWRGTLTELAQKGSRTTHKLSSAPTTEHLFWGLYLTESSAWTASGMCTELGSDNPGLHMGRWLPLSQGPLGSVQEREAIANGQGDLAFHPCSFNPLCEGMFHCRDSRACRDRRCAKREGVREKQLCGV